MADRRQSGTSSSGGNRSGTTAEETARSEAASSGAQKPTSSSAEEQIRGLYEQAESATARAFDDFVAKPSFGAMMARSAENVAALSRIGSDIVDLVWRNLRLAGRADITRLARQLHRTDDMLERVLQEVEQLRDELGERPEARQSNGRDPKAGEHPKADR